MPEIISKKSKQPTDILGNVSATPFLDTKGGSDSEEAHLRVQHSPLLSGSSVEEKRKEILKYVIATFELYEKLYEPLVEEAFYQVADRLRHPLIFYMGHTAVFYVNKLQLAGLLPQRFNPLFESIFAVGVDEMSWDDLIPPTDGWPALAEVMEYRKQVLDVLKQAIETCTFSLPITWDSPMWAILMGAEHERIHLETSSVLIRQLPLKYIKPGSHDFWSICPHISGPAPENQLVSVIDEPRKVRLGKSHESDDVYGWDVEYGKLESEVPPFKASQYLVSNQEYLEFISDKGYQTREFWTEEGWKWVQFKNSVTNNNPMPLFWVIKEEGGKKTYFLRTMLQEIPMPWSWPIETNYLEAKAFCNWKKRKTGQSIRLPTEDEYEVMRDFTPGDHTTWSVSPGNLNLEFFCSSSPVNLFPPNNAGLYDVVGNVWQHTETPVDAYPGFKVHELYDDFSVPTFDLMHNLIKGGSWISTGNEALRRARYAFRRHFFQHAGFRYVETDRPVVLRTNTYEKDELVNFYLHFHYSDEIPFGVKNFCVALSEHIGAAATRHESETGFKISRVCDMGCATGRLTFELAKRFEQCVGLDFSARFIRKAVDLQNAGKLSYHMYEEGDLTSTHSVTLADIDAQETAKRCKFWQADACNLDPRYTGYDLVVAINLIDRLPDPSIFLEAMMDRINKGGLLIISSPYTWLEEYTPKNKWLGGYVDDKGKQVTTLEGLKAKLSSHFTMVGEPIDVPFVIRETKRKHQHTLSEFTVWKKL